MKIHYSVLAVFVVAFLSGIHPAFALTISPVKVEVSGDAGQTLRGEIEMLNEQVDTKTFYSSFENFEPSGDSGAPRFVGAKDGLATWMQTSSGITIKNSEKVKVPYTITIPEGTEPGGYFAAIFWGEQDPAAQAAGEVSIGGKLGVLILLRVNGYIEEEAGISDFGFADGGRVLTSLPAQITYKFANGGGDRVVPLGDIVIKNIFGGITATLPANKNEGSVLPNSARKFTIIWGNETDLDKDFGFLTTAKNQLSDFHLGFYTAEANVVSGVANTPEHSKFTFVMFPWQLLTLVFGGLIMLFILLKKYNAWIVSRSK